MSYGELNRRANQVAHYLRALGVGPETLVGLCIERSLLDGGGSVGILKAGAAYVPLDPAYPPERLAFMLEDAQLPVVLTQERHLRHVLRIMGMHGMSGLEWPHIAQHSDDNPVSGATADQSGLSAVYVRIDGEPQRRSWGTSCYYERTGVDVAGLSLCQA